MIIEYVALSSKSTFRRSMQHCLEDRISNILARIIAVVDTNCNLSLLLVDNNPEWKQMLWLSIFSDERVACTAAL
jgi:hypothetical protein